MKKICMFIVVLITTMLLTGCSEADSIKRDFNIELTIETTITDYVVTPTFGEGTLNGNVYSLTISSIRNVSIIISKETYQTIQVDFKAEDMIGDELKYSVAFGSLVTSQVKLSIKSDDVIEDVEVVGLDQSKFTLDKNIITINDVLRTDDLSFTLKSTGNRDTEVFISKEELVVGLVQKDAILVKNGHFSVIFNLDQWDRVSVYGLDDDFYKETSSYVILDETKDYYYVKNSKKVLINKKVDQVIELKRENFDFNYDNLNISTVYFIDESNNEFYYMNPYNKTKYVLIYQNTYIEGVHTIKFYMGLWEEFVYTKEIENEYDKYSQTYYVIDETIIDENNEVTIDQFKFNAFTKELEKEDSDYIFGSQESIKEVTIDSNKVSLTFYSSEETSVKIPVNLNGNVVGVIEKSIIFFSNYVDLNDIFEYEGKLYYIQTSLFVDYFAANNDTYIKSVLITDADTLLKIETTFDRTADDYYLRYENEVYYNNESYVKVAVGANVTFYLNNHFTGTYTTKTIQIKEEYITSGVITLDESLNVI